MAAERKYRQRGYMEGTARGGTVHVRTAPSAGSRPPIDVTGPACRDSSRPSWPRLLYRVGAVASGDDIREAVRSAVQQSIAAAVTHFEINGFNAQPIRRGLQSRMRHDCGLFCPA